MTYTHEELLVGIAANCDIANHSVSQEEAEGAASMAYTLAIAAMMLDDDLNDLPIVR